MSIVQENDTITISFTGKLDNGAVFKEILPDNPLKITIGQSELPPTVESGLTGMSQGESKKIRVPPEEGYGPRMKDLLHILPLSSFGEKLDVKPGMILSQKVEKDGEMHQVPATVIEVNGDEVTIDYNHPMAGHHLTYEITVIEILK